VSSPDLLVTVDLAVRRGRATDRTRVQHALWGDVVETVAAVGHVPVRHLDVHEWPGELGRLCRVAVPADAPRPPADGPDLPWDLVVGTGAALAQHRPDLYDELLARADDRVRMQVGRLHRATVGRLRSVAGLPHSRRVGWISWLLFADGWRALTPYLDRGPGGSCPMVRLERRWADDLARDVARWATGVRR
jgi:hypothetical protein